MTWRLGLIPPIRLKASSLEPTRGKSAASASILRSSTSGERWLVVDDELGYIYASDESRAIRKYYADPDRGDDNQIVAFAKSDGISATVRAWRFTRAGTAPAIYSFPANTIPSSTAIVEKATAAILISTARKFRKWKREAQDNHERAYFRVIALRLSRRLSAHLGCYFFP